MPRPLVYSNGSLMLAYDAGYSIRELFYPVVGIDNHLSGRKIRTGIWVDGSFSWLDEEGWERHLALKDSVFYNQFLRIKLVCKNGFLTDQNVWKREMEIINLREETVQVRIFLSQDLAIAENRIGGCALYDPRGALVHYKGPFAFAFTGEAGGRIFDQYAIGINGFHGMEGTWKDAEDGELSMNPISLGAVDSVIRVSLSIGANETARASFSMAAARDLDSAVELLKGESSRNLSSPLKERGGRACDLGKEIPTEWTSAFESSIHFLYTQIGQNGAILAANDSDIMGENTVNYSYVWPRDGAFVAEILDRLGDRETSRKYLEFIRPLITSDKPYFYQKYRADGTLGASWHPWTQPLPIQEDETALTLTFLDNHFAEPDAWLESQYDSFVKPMADFLLAHRDGDLPRPSYDLWEERWGVHCFTTATVIAGLSAAARLASKLNRPHEIYQEACEAMRGAFEEQFFDEERLCFRRSSGDSMVDASSLQVSLLGVLPADHPKVIANMNTVRERLWVRTEIGGLARNESDYYARISHDVPGNPWFITTLWLAQVQIQQRNLNAARELIEWAMRWSAESGAMSEQIHPYTGEPLTVSPLTWSHAELIKTVLDWANA